ncbi:hypothetical protein FPV67DRAFT_870797 [Lyophyllum atratum]|nr:hypothetical protein FPV67DRAFT_870797 [Lyophyllum atratum]
MRDPSLSWFLPLRLAIVVLPRLCGLSEGRSPNTPSSTHRASCSPLESRNNLVLHCARFLNSPLTTPKAMDEVVERSSEPDGYSRHIVSSEPGGFGRGSSTLPIIITLKCQLFPELAMLDEIYRVVAPWHMLCIHAETQVSIP